MKASTSFAVLAAAVLLSPACSDSTASKAPVVTVAAIPATDHQRAAGGTALPAPLQVLVLTNGKPTAGQAVSWSPSEGSMSITSGITDSNGVASAQWTVGRGAGEHAAYATVVGALGSPVQFTATALSSEKAGTTQPTKDDRSTP